MMSSACEVRERKTRDVACVDRFDQQLDARRLQTRRRELQVPDRRTSCASCTFKIRRTNPQPGNSSVCSPEVPRRPTALRRSLRDSATRSGRQAMPRSPPPVAGRQVVQGLHQLMICELLLQEADVVVVGEQVFDRFESCVSRRTKAVQKIQLGEQHRQVGGEFGHRSDAGVQADPHEATAVYTPVFARSQAGLRTCATDKSTRLSLLHHDHPAQHVHAAHKLDRSVLLRRERDVH